MTSLSGVVYTHVCLDCGTLGVAGGYHDHGNGNAGETLRLTELPALIRSFQDHEQAQYEAEEEVERLRGLVQIIAANIGPFLPDSAATIRAALREETPNV